MCSIFLYYTKYNYTNADIEQWNCLLDKTERYVWQFEEGEEKQTKHIQGHIVFKNPISFNSLKKQLPRAHIEKVRNIKASEEYCQKLNSSTSNPKIKGFEHKKTLKERIIEIEYKNVVWYDWQREILDIIEGPVNKRTVIWVWEKTGNVGKTYLAKYIKLKYDCIIASGKTTDIFNQLKCWREKNPDIIQLPTVLIDNPRSEFGHINYAAIEQIKNGFIYSGKYEGGEILGISPHIIVFANDKPEYKQLSLDRFHIIDLNEDEEESEDE